MKSRFSKTEAKKEIEEFFLEIKKKTTKEIKKIKKLAMKHNIPLKKKRKLFCRNCLTHFSGKEKIKIKKKIKSVTCKECGSVARWKIK